MNRFNIVKIPTEILCKYFAIYKMNIPSIIWPAERDPAEKDKN